jgi:ligand-binding SRPBCC domain-containing protein
LLVLDLPGHDHDFVARNEYVIMKDIFEFQSPLGLIGKLVDKIFMTKYLENFLTERNIIIKEFAESDKWK